MWDTNRIQVNILPVLPKILITELAKTAIKTGVDTISSVVGGNYREENGLQRLNENLRKEGITTKVIQNYSGFSNVTQLEKIVMIMTDDD